MERDTNDTFGNPNTTSSAGTGSPSSFDADTTSTPTTEATSTSDTLADVGSSARERAGNLKHTIADALESGAERLRRQGGGALAPATAGSADTVADDSRIAQTSNQLAGGLQGAADWIRDADLDGLKAGIEKQVKEHPGRSLAIAIGVGYLLGKAIRR